MWHWNSFWARAPGDPPTLGDPALWQAPWTIEQAAALQARSWEAMLTAGQSWWSCMFSMWPMPSWPLTGQLTPRTEATTRPAAPPAARRRPPSPNSDAVHPPATHPAARRR